MITGVSLGTTLVQTRGSIGGARSVFVKLQGMKNDLVFPTFGGMLQNPFRQGGKIFAGDLFEYRTDDNGLHPKLYLLKTFVVSATSTGKTIKIRRDGYVHVPSVGDVLMVAPEKVGGEGTTTTVTNVAISDGLYTLTVDTSLSVSQNDVLVEADSDGTMLVKNPNTWAATDYDLFYAPATGDEDFDGARYMITPALHAIAYTNRMSPLPDCVKALNRSKVNGWFEI